MSRYIFGLDIGTASVKGAVWRPERSGGGTLLAHTEAPIETGMQRGIIRDIEEVAARSAKVVEELSQMSRKDATRGVIAVGGMHLETRLSKGSVIVSRADREVTDTDVDRALDMAKSIARTPNRRPLHIVPRSFSLDGKEAITNPVGAEGYHLDVEGYVIDGFAPAVKLLEKALEMADVESELLVAAPLAGARAALTKKDREVGSVSIDFGAGTTSIAVFEEDALLHAAVIPYGSQDITKDIAFALKIPLEVAEAVKLDVSNAAPQRVDKREQVALSRYMDAESEYISKRYVSEIIEARLEEIFEFAAQELKKIDRLGKLASGAVVFGGGARLRGIETVGKKTLRMPCRVGTLEHLGRHFSESLGLQFFTTCGLILWGVDERGGEIVGGDGSRGWSALGRIKGFFRLFLP